MEKITSFNSFSLPESLHLTLGQMAFATPTPIQAAAIPAALEGRDILGTAQTGTGKTGAFCIPLLSRLYAGDCRRALILAPTRELAGQIFTVLRQMGKGLKMVGTLVIGGESFNRQVNELGRDIDYIVATPGRLNDHLIEGTVDLGDVQLVVLDEVDRMLDMGFAPQIQKVMSRVPKERQTLLFSATLPKEIQGLAANLLKSPVRAEVGTLAVKPPEVTEENVSVSHDKKNALLLERLQNFQEKAIIFTRTQHRADRLRYFLEDNGFAVGVLHGGLTQGKRKRALSMFRSGECQMLVATDLAGRGIDVSDIDWVINFDMPANREDYIHRIGRTGRAGKKGAALNLIAGGDWSPERRQRPELSSVSGSGGRNQQRRRPRKPFFHSSGQQGQKRRPAFGKRPKRFAER